MFVRQLPPLDPERALKVGAVNGGKREKAVFGRRRRLQQRRSVLENELSSCLFAILSIDIRHPTVWSAISSTNLGSPSGHPASCINCISSNTLQCTSRAGVDTASGTKIGSGLRRRLNTKRGVNNFTLSCNRTKPLAFVPRLTVRRKNDCGRVDCRLLWHSGPTSASPVTRVFANFGAARGSV